MEIIEAVLVVAGLTAAVVGTIHMVVIDGYRRVPRRAR
jgi:hypothetical protein